MPFSKVGEKISFGADNYLKLKGKGDKVHLRLLGEPYYDGKHFLKDGDDWDIQVCVRINEGGKCELCNQYFDLMKQKKQADENKDQTASKELEKEARKWKNTVTFYFPIIDRGDETFKIFQTTISIKGKFDAEQEAGVNVFDKDFVITRTEESPANYYSLVRLDSADTKKLTPKEKIEAAKYDQETFLSLIKPVSKKDKAELVQSENKEPLPWEDKPLSEDPIES